MDALLAVVMSNPNVAVIYLGITSAVTLASVIVKFTPSKKDDEIVGKIQKVLNTIALNPKR